MVENRQQELIQVRKKNYNILWKITLYTSYHRSEGHVAAVDPGKSKVSQLHLALAGYQNILWFQVSVHHAVRVKECKTTQQLLHQILQKHKQSFTGTTYFTAFSLGTGI